MMKTIPLQYKLPFENISCNNIFTLTRVQFVSWICLEVGLFQFRKLRTILFLKLILLTSNAAMNRTIHNIQSNNIQHSMNTCSFRGDNSHSGYWSLLHLLMWLNVGHIRQ
jgi:hypothetical protein